MRRSLDPRRRIYQAWTASGRTGGAILLSIFRSRARLERKGIFTALSSFWLARRRESQARHSCGSTLSFPSLRRSQSKAKGVEMKKRGGAFFSSLSFVFSPRVVVVVDFQSKLMFFSHFFPPLRSTLLKQFPPRDRPTRAPMTQGELREESIAERLRVGGEGRTRERESDDISQPRPRTSTSTVEVSPHHLNLLSPPLTTSHHLHPHPPA